MKIVDEYFIKKAEKVSFVQLKRGAKINVDNYTIDDKIPLPIITDTLVEEIKEGSLQEELQMAHIVDGIIYILGIDKDFRYKEEYKNILYNYNSKIENYILYRGLGLAEKERLEEASIVFRALVNLNPKNVEGLFNYALSLEDIGKKYIDMDNKDKGEAFLLEATNLMETILDIEENFPLAYYKLGYYYKYFQQFQKSKLIWEKYLKLDEDPERLNEIREELHLIEDDANYEVGINYLTIGQYERALEKLMPLSYKYEEWWNIFYLVGLAYKGLGEYEEAIDFFYKALDLGGTDVNIYNELGICLYLVGNIKEAISIFGQGINQNNKDYWIIFNRGLAYLKLGIMDKAKKDIEKAYKLNPNDDIVKDHYEKIKGIFKR
ncbi:tetratricopeptide repeat protein [Tepidimicrobium xylanilyticum]|uniref:Tetratricopeptide repeat-containing protein n=1 Tax=Tepidimicrobium xylanilyticum TaxID=1123352 RepID=A0A1H3BHT4_9FIRM|nr:tetratricopeptide repeat protein [Tepidimicrobium xylanilyticum]GMG96897.1 hypothetical protein EN5CB1_17230 [Tepidimicrobium xylanilyticum]SDX41486.1 Tetratricopeptide repeat-containing protein [Tepidimicrobium xylanilyticum]